jgi:hypothetical protein
MPAQSSGAVAAQVHSRGHAQHEPLIHDDRARVTALRRFAGFLLGATIRPRVAGVAVLLQPLRAAGAAQAAVHHASHAHVITDGKRVHLGADGGHTPHYFMAGHLRVGDRAPLAADRMEVRMADPAEQDLDGHIARARGAAVERPWAEWPGGGKGGNAGSGSHTVKRRGTGARFI